MSVPKSYFLQFGSGNPQSFAGLSPTFIIFMSEGSTTIAGPAITEVGTSVGIYGFKYLASPTYATAFIADGGAGLASSDRYVGGVLDAVSNVDQQIGQTTDSFGSTSADPTTILGYLKRIQELLEGDATFTKSSAAWQIFSRNSSTLIRSKNLTNTTTSATKTGL